MGVQKHVHSRGKHTVASVPIGAHSLLPVWRRLRDALPTESFFKELAMRHVEGQIQELFGLSCPLRANTRIQLYPRADVGLKGIALDNMVDLPNVMGAEPIDRVARQHQPLGSAPADITWQPECAQPGDDALLDCWEPQRTIFRGDAMVKNRKMGSFMTG
jgi:hypothetical protein